MHNTEVSDEKSRKQAENVLLAAESTADINHCTVLTVGRVLASSSLARWG